MSILASLFLNACSVIGAGSYEEPAYTLVEKDGKIEIREYEPFLIAKTVVSGDYDRASGDGFNRLAAYIFGENRSKAEMAMTTPVIQEEANGEAGEKMDMTTPLVQEESGNGWMMAFVIPAKYTMETVPEPIDSNVILEQVPGRLVAAIRYSGMTDEEKMADKEAELRAWLEERDFNILSDARSARYDPPWTLPFLRRNEILIDIAPPTAD
ncbi:heme-binding protein [candidate division GN15 bacterium]|nr:heme-binding protein [candidate division GN15 bacterium]